MRKKQLYMIELNDDKYVDSNKNTEFLENFKTAVFMSLLERGKLTKRQFDFCMGELKR